MEIALAMTVLLVSLLSISATTLGSHTLRRQNRERVLALNAVRAMSERIHSTSYTASLDDGTWASQLVATYGPDGTFGNTFDAPELNRVDPDTPVGTITLILDETATDAELDVELGLPRDLDGDGLTTNTDVSDRARILPILLEITWEGVSGIQTVRHPFYVLGY